MDRLTWLSEDSRPSASQLVIDCNKHNVHRRCVLSELCRYKYDGQEKKAPTRDQRPIPIQVNLEPPVST